VSYQLPYGRSYGYFPPLGQYPSTIADNNAYIMKLIGTASVKGKPDKASAVLGVITESVELNAAQSENALKVTQILNALKQMGIAGTNIETQSYSVEPVYDYVDGKQVFRYYRVQHDLSVVIDNLDEVGAAIDTAVSNGANVVRNVEFILSDPSSVYLQALILSIQDAIQKARAIEENFRIAVNKTPTKILEQSYAYTTFPAQDFLRAPVGTTPIQARQIEITARVRAEFTYRPI
jgi:uncharacterized protein YggE